MGDFEANRDLLDGNLARYGVCECMELYAAFFAVESLSGLERQMDLRDFSGFPHDADGRRDCDFALFWPWTSAGGLVVIDDHAGEAQLCLPSVRNPQGGIKKRLTFRLMNALLEAACLQLVSRWGETLFARKPKGIRPEIPPHEALARIVAEVERERDDSLSRRRLL